MQSSRDLEWSSWVSTDLSSVCLSCLDAVLVLSETEALRCPERVSFTFPPVLLRLVPQSATSLLDAEPQDTAPLRLFWSFVFRCVFFFFYSPSISQEIILSMHKIYASECSSVWLRCSTAAVLRSVCFSRSSTPAPNPTTIVSTTSGAEPERVVFVIVDVPCWNARLHLGMILTGWDAWWTVSQEHQMLL